MTTTMDQAAEASLEYRAFLDGKSALPESVGIDVPLSSISPVLYPFQRQLVQLAVKKGRVALFADTGLGKTLMQLEWARWMLLKSKRVLIVAPLAVAQQTATEAAKLGLLVFRKPGLNVEPILPEITNDQWIEWARPIWYNIRESDTLNVAEARSDKDERHIAPLQLGTIERCIALWSNKGDLVFSPFAGIGSEGYQAIKQGRRFVGIELKPEYFEVARRNLQAAELANKQGVLL